MHTYNTLSEAVNDLKKRGYTYDLNLIEAGIECPELNAQYNSEQIEVDEFHRFEGDSSVDDSSIVYAIRTDQGVQGTLVHAYGTYAQEIPAGLLEKLKMH